MSDLITILIFGTAIGALPVIMIADTYLRCQFAASVARNWQYTRRTVQFTPVRATFFGKIPRRDYASVRRYNGAIGIADDTLRFEAQRNDTFLEIPLTAIKWMGSQRICTHRGKNSTYRMALVVHFQETFPYNAPWRVATFVTPQNEEILATLNRLTGLGYATSRRGHADFGPFDATRMDQDIYGQWHEATRRTLYVAPKWFMYNFCDPVPFAQLRKIEVIARGGLLNDLIPLLEELLRLEYTDTDGKSHTAGYMTRHADALAKELSRRSGVPYHTHAGRKKK